MMMTTKPKTVEQLKQAMAFSSLDTVAEMQICLHLDAAARLHGPGSSCESTRGRRGTTCEICEALGAK